MDVDQLSRLITATSPVIQAIIWPLLILYVVIHFNTDIKNFLINISEISVKLAGIGIEATAKKTIESAAFAGAAIQKRKSESDSPNESEISEIANTISEATGSKSISKTSVLWVDDTPSNNILERRALEALGISFTISTDTRDALDKLSSYKYDLIVTDMKRPGDNLAGYTLLEEMIKSGNKTPLIIYTGYSTNEQRADAKRKGAFDCTYDPQELFELVLKAIPNKK
jgi:CheY-like chemotaxis protein